MLKMIPVAVDYDRAGLQAPKEKATLNLMILPHLDTITMNPDRPMVIVMECTSSRRSTSATSPTSILRASPSSARA